MPCEDCLAKGLPESLCSDGKPSPLDFEEAEIIYRRHTEPGNVAALKGLKENEIGRSIFKIEDDSYNRSLVSSADQVLLNENPTEAKDLNYYSNWGIIGLSVEIVNSIGGIVKLNNVDTECTLQVHHTPTDCNYSHCEIFVFLNGERRIGKAPKSVTPFVRRTLQAQLNVIKEYATGT
jgi:hypothetical protein